MWIGDLIANARIWVKIEAEPPVLRGRFRPRLLLPLRLSTPTERIEVTLPNVRVQLLHGDEVLGEGWLLGEAASWHGRQSQLEIPLGVEAIDRVTASLGPNAAVDLHLSWYGQIVVTWEPTPADNPFASSPEPGVPTAISIASNTTHLLSVTRTQWYASVVAPLGDVEFRFFEIAIPRGDTGTPWRNSLARLADAERAYTLGDDAGAFNQLRGCLDALPGAKQAIFDALPEPKRTDLNTLTAAVGKYLHAGRHVTAIGEDKGSFPVDHQDAAFALNLMRVLLAHVSQVLSARHRA